MELSIVWDEALSKSGVCLKLSSVEESMADLVKLKWETVRFEQNTV